MDLVPYMYFERQEPGSQLCAQHCLNNVLQQYTYSEFDLADIAKKLDQAENATLDASHQNKKSYNLDDTGFFSISVLERALEVWDLSLVRWRGEAMKAYQEHPEDQTAFILNLSSHWLPLRRFAPNPPHSSATKRWYNLNSFHENPQWISPTYLRLFLTQAEQEGYSVFVVRKARSDTAEGQDTGEGQGWEDGGIAQLPECLADQMAVELGEPVGRGGPVSSGSAGGLAKGQWGVANFNPDVPTVDLSGPSQAQAGPSSPPARRKKRQEDLTPSDPIEEDEFSRPPVTASRTRHSSSRSTPAMRPVESADIFDDESFPLQDDDAHAGTGTNTASRRPGHGMDDDEDEEILSDNEDLLGAGDPGRTGGIGIGAGAGRHPNDAFYSGPTDFQFHSRSYDDEDEALQAALKASMMDLPPGWEAPPELPPKEAEKPSLKSTTNTTSSKTGNARIAPANEQASAASTSTPIVPTPNWRPVASDVQVKKKEEEEVEEEDDDDDEKPAESVSADEIRRRRLARFGQ